MSRLECPTYTSEVNFPVFGLGFTSSNQLLVCGGGGAGRSGVRNKLVSYRVDPRRKDLEEEAVYDFSSEEDAPMCLDVHPTDDVVLVGANETEEKLKRGENKNCRVFKPLEASFESITAINTISTKTAEEYQKVVRFSADGSLVATGTSNGQVHVFNYPEYTPLCDMIQASEDDEVTDVDITLEKDKLTCLTRDAIKLVNLRGKNIGKIMRTISPTTLDKKQKIQFRAFRYGRVYTKDFAFLAANSPAGGWVYKLDAYTLERSASVKVSKKPITAFCISREGGMVAVATADFTLLILDSLTLRVLHQVKEAHGFSITSIAISHDRRLLVTGSADNTCRVISLPQQFPSASAMIHPLKTVFLAVLTAFLLIIFLNYFYDSPSESSESFPVPHVEE
ncbi:quinon protein alcohol dehydrogenase-like superfamily [Dichotomocladium elegans]|nr:quinon protein alcohol dehydrogenase-like superfamily [Dichotomocladium elegans]